MRQRIAAGKFRADLFDRLAFDIIELPPLRARKGDIPGDIPALATHFLARFAEEAHTRPREVSPEAIAALSRHDYPGNVRKLKHIVERAAFRCEGDALTADAVESALPATATAPSADVAGSGGFEERVAAFEKGLLVKALHDTRCSQKDAATLLGLTYDQFRHMYRKYGLKDGG